VYSYVLLRVELILLWSFFIASSFEFLNRGHLQKIDPDL